eukprot:TRINITY_DN38710_c0_g1_i1.p1 TRINITY_DN38710_c0_g1~~TRINITY_DN38710_c0_g1_i1.p1  ORF type:complete len:396 (-),score=60.47 TRINITY_DN38710_c0_g1_i1:153-1340(-)
MVSRRLLMGFAMLGTTIMLWVGSSVAVQAIFENVELHFERPVFITLFNSSMSTTLLLPEAMRGLFGHVRGRPGGNYNRGAAAVALATSDSSSSSASSAALLVRLSATLGFLWLCGQCIFNWSLLYTSVATSTVLSSTSSVFAFFFSLVICREPFRILSFGAALLSFAGCSVVALQTPGRVNDSAIPSTTLGTVLTVSASALFALVSVLLRRMAPPDVDMSRFMGMTGVFSAVAAPGLLFAAHRSGLETFQTPPIGTLGIMTLNALLGCTLANYLYNSAILLLSPLLATVCMSMSIPVSAFVDQILLSEHRFSIGWICGAAITTCGAVLAAFDYEEPPSDAAGEYVRNEVQARHGRKDCEKAEDHEMEPLIDSAGENDTSDVNTEIFLGLSGLPTM